MSRNITKLLMFVLMSVLLCSLPAARAWADGTVYAMTNALGNNQIVVYHRAQDGTLTLIQTIATGGGGGGVQLNPPVDSLGSQGSLQLDSAHRRLFAVNTESLAANTQDCQVGTITSFLVASDGSLTFADRVMSGGLYPDSLTINKNLLFVLNSGGPGADSVCGIGPNITGFTVSKSGYMSFRSNSMQEIDPGALDGTGSGENCNIGGFPVPAFNCGRNPPAFPRGPAQVRFTPKGKQLVVTVKGTNSIYVFPVNKHGKTGTPTLTQAPGPALPTYFGLDFDRKGHMILTEAFGSSTSIPNGGQGAVSSFTITKTGSLNQISASVGDLGTAACWVALDPTTGQYAYVSNNLSNNISSYSVGRDGSVTLLAAAAATGSGPNDSAVVGDNGASFFYVLFSGSGTVGAFQVNLGDGSLIPLMAAGGLPINDAAQGLAAY